MSQDGQYVDIPGGSQHYIYDNGEDINGWSHEEFAALIGGLAEELDISPELRTAIEAGFSDYFGGFDPDYDGGVAAPERAEIFCQCVDSRISSLSLTDELHDAVQEWLDAQDVMTVCDFCDEEFRPYLEAETCGSDECKLQRRAERWNVSTEIIQNSDRLFDELHFERDWPLREASDAQINYITTYSPSEL
jgi:hypothetical protein